MIHKITITLLVIFSLLSIGITLCLAEIIWTVYIANYFEMHSYHIIMHNGRAISPLEMAIGIISISVIDIMVIYFSIFLFGKISQE